MGFAATFVPEFDQEMATTRRVLERVPVLALVFVDRHWRSEYRSAKRR